jgi:DNA mismatch repair protein MutL
MGAIKVLDKSLIEKIAAGEVIERPSSVVKELIENAIDASADSLVIEVKSGGTNFIRITDNGKGMDKDDLEICFQQHATSKISDLQDLFKVGTLGFRGEALSSIATISNLEISSRQKDSDFGYTIYVQGGEIKERKEKGIPKGTTIIVKDLFFNTPVRKKHLKGERTELTHIIDIIERYSLSDKELSFQLISDGKEILNIPASKDMLNKIVMLHGKETAKHMLPIYYRNDFCNVSGYIGKPYLARKDKKQQSIFVNGRYIKNQTISKALYDAYHTLLFLERHPACILYIDIDLTKTDVNVHPTKEIIRIEQEDKLYDSIFNAVSTVFQKDDLIPEVDIPDAIGSDSVFTRRYSSPQKQQPLPTRRYPIQIDTQKILVEESKTSRSSAMINQNQELADTTEHKTGHEKKNYPEQFQRTNNEQVTETRRERIGPVKILGQLNLLYILAENPEGLLIIDQHAAQERVYFERFMTQFGNNKIAEQKLLRAKVIEVTHREYSVIHAHLDILKKLGFGIEEYGKNTFRIDVVPQIFGFFSDELMLDIINEIEAKDSKSMNEKIEERIARKACRKAIKAGDMLTEPQMINLIENLETCEKPYSCPHGRPTIIKMSLKELDKRFKRVC